MVNIQRPSVWFIKSFGFAPGGLFISSPSRAEVITWQNRFLDTKDYFEILFLTSMDHFRGNHQLDRWNSENISKMSGCVMKWSLNLWNAEKIDSGHKFRFRWQQHWNDFQNEILVRGERILKFSELTIHEILTFSIKNALDLPTSSSWPILLTSSALTIPVLTSSWNIKEFDEFRETLLSNVLDCSRILCNF